MEFPDLGQHCSDSRCKRLDFLPVNCDMCKKTFCSDHFSYVQHNCPLAFSKDAQVPVCPLCNSLIPGKPGELPDIRVGRHIDSDCKSDKAVNRRKVYANRCSFKGCKQKELIPVNCNQCTQNFCLRHRHPLDHSCTQTSSKPLNKAGLAAAMRKQASVESKMPSRSVGGGNSGSSTSSARSSNASQSIQGNMSDDVALQLALQASLMESGSSGAPSGLTAPLSSEHEEMLLAQAIAESKREHRAGSSTGRKGNNCRVS